MAAIRSIRCLAMILVLALVCLPVRVEARVLDDRITIAAASSIKPAMDALVERFRQRYPAADILVTYGSSGKISTQIIHGAPFDLFFSADLAYPQTLVQQGKTASKAWVYALGRLALWQRGTVEPALADLAAPKTDRVAIANPRHAPYGERAREVLVNLGLWKSLQARLVFGENVAQTAQFVQSGAADLGFIALSLALNPTMQAQGRYQLIDASLHRPLEHGYVLTRRAAGNETAAGFSRFMASKEAGEILQRYGFEAPDSR